MKLLNIFFVLPQNFLTTSIFWCLKLLKENFRQKTFLMSEKYSISYRCILGRHYYFFCKLKTLRRNFRLPPIFLHYKLLSNDWTPPCTWLSSNDSHTLGVCIWRPGFPVVFTGVGMPLASKTYGREGLLLDRRKSIRTQRKD